MRRKLVEVELAIARIAARQHGVISLDQLLMLGLSHSGIRRRVASGRLFRIHRGVYAVGHVGLTQRGKWKAATMACGAHAVLSHRSAAELWGLVAERGGDSHITVPVAGGRARRDGIRQHRIPSLPRGATTSRDNIPVTSPQRTLEDLRSTIENGDFRRAVREAELQNLPIDAERLLPDRAVSAAEASFLALCRRHRLPTPEVNARVGRYRVDFLWREAWLVVEADGRRYHRGLVAADDDIEREFATPYRRTCGDNSSS
ncbi:MAG TPA: type IV toxin-antitoxin system AbiEi family antitoxin domain-containing protein [Solirubrobacterales bacterium]|nr:type IV toxin-antitoxin system AbiEi family antitoxin domain-containing protein [Solirubrobacterales bacterium]